MKKLIHFVIIIQLLLTACSKDDTTRISLEEFLKEVENVCISATDAVSAPPGTAIPGDATGVKGFFNLIPDETIRSMSTCGLLETLLKYYRIGPWHHASSSLYFPAVTWFNDNLRANKVAMELFNRNDVFSVLVSKYPKVIKDSEETNYTLPLQYFEILLASDMCMAALNKEERILLMGLVLKKMEAKYLNTTCHVMIAVMKSCNYTPFMKTIGAKLQETANGYTFDSPDKNGLHHIGLGDYRAGIIVNYAKRFLKDTKIRML